MLTQKQFDNTRTKKGLSFLRSLEFYKSEYILYAHTDHSRVSFLLQKFTQFKARLVKL